MTVSRWANGHASRRLERNWELTDPGIVVRPPTRGPRISTGGHPPEPCALKRAPSRSSARSSGRIGRRRRLASPVRNVGAFRRAAIPVSSRKVVPEFRASISAFDGRSSSHTMRKEFLSRATVAPSASMPATDASVSSERSGCPMRQGPPDRALMNTARWVYDFEGGARTVPSSLDALATNFTRSPPYGLRDEARDADLRFPVLQGADDRVDASGSDERDDGGACSAHACHQGPGGPSPPRGRLVDPYEGRIGGAVHLEGAEIVPLQGEAVRFVHLGANRGEIDSSKARLRDHSTGNMQDGQEVRRQTVDFLQLAGLVVRHDDAAEERCAGVVEGTRNCHAGLQGFVDADVDDLERLKGHVEHSRARKDDRIGHGGTALQPAGHRDLRIDRHLEGDLATTAPEDVLRATDRKVGIDPGR